jgi:hypothetical protein
MVFQCYRCFYYCKNKKDMKKHLIRKNICGRKVESFNYEEDKIEYLSLLNKSDDEIIIIKEEEHIVGQYVDWKYDENELKQIIDKTKNNNNKKCCFCNKAFFRKYELLRHLENNQCSVLKEKKNKNIIHNNYIDNKTINNQNINNQINNQQINNISINVYNNSNIVNENGEKIMNGFNDEWDISKIDLQKKLLLFVSDNKYSNTMEEILKNDKNMNILLGENENDAIVFQENKFMNLNNDEIIVRTMYKLYNHLLKFYTDIKGDNLINKDLKEHKENLKEKYDDFNNNNITKEIVKNILLDIFHNKKEEVLEKFSEFNKYLSIDENTNKLGF